MIRARDELEAWLGRHPGHELEGSVRELLAEARRRVVENDLHVARFYERIENAFGTQYHASRALDAARVAEDPELIARCEALLQAATELQGEIDPSRFLPPQHDDPVEESFGITIEEGTTE